MLKTVFHENKSWIATTYVLMVAEFAVFSMIPFLLGRAVDGLIAEQYTQFWHFVGASFLGLLLGFSRRRLDTRVFRWVWAEKSVGDIMDMERRNVNRPFILNRVGMVGTYGDFFEFTVPCFVSAILEFTIAFIMIWLAVPRLAYTLGIMASVAVLVIWIFSFFIQRNEKETQVIREETDSKIVHNETQEIEGWYEKLRRKYVQRSDLDAACWRLVHLFWILSDIISILVLVKYSQSVGTIMSTLIYTGKIFEKAGQFSFFFNHLKQIEVVNQVLRKD